MRIGYARVSTRDQNLEILRLCTTWIIATAGMDKTVPALFLSADIRKCCGLAQPVEA
jgi:hypothetical protein